MIFYRWFTVSAARSWFAHFLVCWLAAALAGVLASYLNQDAILLASCAATALLFFYSYKEAGDELRYRREGTYQKRRWIDKVKPATDSTGDLLGPVAVCATCWLCYILLL